MKKTKPIGFATSWQNSHHKKALGEIVAKSYRRYGPQTFTERFQGLYKSSSSILALCHVISIFLASVFMAYILSMALTGKDLGYIWANYTGSEKWQSIGMVFCASLTIWGLIELIKVKSYSNAFLSYYAKNYWIMIPAFALALATTGGSLYSSVKGGDFAGEITATLPQAELVDTSFIKREYRQKINNIQLSIDNARKNRKAEKPGWWAEHSLIPKWESRIYDLERQMSLDLAGALSANGKKELKQMGMASISGFTFGSISLLCEIVIIMLLAFREYYSRRSSIAVVQGDIEIKVVEPDQLRLQAPITAYNGSNGTRIANYISAVPFRSIFNGSGYNGPESRKNGFRITCKQCGNKAIKKRENAEFCSKECKNEYHSKSKTP